MLRNAAARMAGAALSLAPRQAFMRAPAAPSFEMRRGMSYTPDRVWSVYLSGEIHSDWREQIAAGVAEKDLKVELASPNTSHEDSDDCAAIIIGDEEKRPNYDNKGARMNSLRTKTLLEEADIVVVRFGDKYRQWNAAFEAGYATAINKPVIVLHPPELGHALKEVNAFASAVCDEPVQVVQTLDYIITGRLPPPRTPGFVPMVDRLKAK